MKQPALDRIEEAIKELLEGKGDPLKLVNAFIQTPGDEEMIKAWEEKMKGPITVLPEYWIHRFCALAEILRDCAKKDV